MVPGTMATEQEHFYFQAAADVVKPYPYKHLVQLWRDEI
jgi:hypothetical protein